MGSLFKSSTTVSKTPFEQNPWKPQQPYLQSGFQQGQTAYNQGQSALSGITDYTANMNGGQVQDIGAMSDYGRNTVGGVAGAAVNTGMGAIGNFGTAGQNYGQLYGMASQDPTQGIIGNAQAYANDPYLQGQIDSALNDVNKAFQRDQSNINSGATSTGNINSTRAGAMEAMALDDAMDRGAAISSQMRGQAYQSGLDRAMTTQQNQFNNMYQANAGLEANGQNGYNMAAQGAGLGLSGLQDSFNANSLLQQQAQAEIDGRVTQANAPLDLVSKYMSAIGGTYGSNGYQSTATQNPSLFQQVLGGVATYAGAGGKFPCWVARAVYGEDNPRWKEFRYWLMTKAPNWFFRLYMKRGEQVANFIHRLPWLKPVLRPLMNLAIT